MSDLQLERSVLEAKERDELFAIALALGTSPAARTKKADLVSHILQVTGVEADAAPAVDKPRRPRARKPAAGAEDGTSTEPDVTQLELANSNGHAPPGRRRPNELRPAAPRRGNGNGHGHQPGHAAPGGSTEAPPRRGTTRAGTAPPASSGPTRDGSATTWIPGSATAGAGGGATGRRRRALREREFTAQAAAEVPYTGELVQCSGLLDLREEGYGFLRTNGYLASSTDVYVSITQVRRYGLRKGDLVEGSFRPGGQQRKVPGAGEGRHRGRAAPGRRPEPAEVRKPDPPLPRRQAEPRDPGRAGQRDGPDSRSRLAHRQGPARADRLAPQGGQDDRPQADRPFHRGQQPRRPPDGPARRRAPGRGNGHAPLGEGRSHRLHLRPARRRAHPGGRARHRAGQAPGRGGAGRRHRARRHHPPGSGLQPGPAGDGPDHVRRYRHRRPVPARRSSSAAPATSKKAGRSRSWPRLWSRRAAAWTR